MAELNALKSDLARAIRLLTAQGLIDFNGHMSYRLPGTDRVLINSRRSSRATLQAQDIVTMDLEGRLIEGAAEPPSEKAIHTRIYAVRPDVLSVAHLHPRVATVFSIAGRPLIPVFTAGAIFPCEGVPVYDDPGLIHSNESGDAVARALGRERAVLLRGHGAVTVGEDMLCCFAASIWLEENAKKQLWASLLGPPHPLAEEECRRLRAQMWKPEVIRKTWDYYVEKEQASP